MTIVYLQLRNHEEKLGRASSIKTTPQRPLVPRCLGRPSLACDPAPRAPPTPRFIASKTSSSCQEAVNHSRCTLLPLSRSASLKGSPSPPLPSTRRTSSSSGSSPFPLLNSQPHLPRHLPSSAPSRPSSPPFTPHLSPPPLSSTSAESEIAHCSSPSSLWRNGGRDEGEIVGGYGGSSAAATFVEGGSEEVAEGGGGFGDGC